MASETDPEHPLLSSHFRGRAVLVTGGYGFVGGVIARRLAELDAEVRLLRRAAPAGEEPEGPGTTVYGDIRNSETWERALSGVDTVFHLAAQTSAKASERDPAFDYEVNADSTWRMLETCRRLGLRARIVLAGTETQVGAPKVLPLRGDERDEPISFYDLHKLVAEEYLEFHARRGFVQGTCLRLTTVYGPGTREGSPDCGMVNAMIRRALAGGPLEIYGTGERLRDYLHVDDVARAFLLAAAAMDRCNARHFILGSGEPHSVKQAIHLVAETTERLTGRPVPVVHVGSPEDEPDIAKIGFSMDPEPFHAATGFRPRYRFADGIAETIRAFQGAVSR